MGRPPCCDKSNTKRGLWTAEEDAKLLAYVSNHGIGNWTLVPKRAGLSRCGKSCRLRWTNYLRPDLKHDSFTPEEEDLIINLHKAVGSRWSLIADSLPGRTDNDVKNYWNTKLKKKLSRTGIDPITHKPMSQVVSDYGNLSSIFNQGNQNISSLSTIPNAKFTLITPEQSPTIPGCSSSEMILNVPTMEQLHYNNQGYYNYESIQPQKLNEVNSACSSSSSTMTSPRSDFEQNISQNQSQNNNLTPNSSFMWSEFINIAADDVNETVSSTKSPSLTENAVLVNTDNDQAEEDQGKQGNNNGHDVSVASASSFVDSILCKDIEMSSQFPGILDLCLDY